MNTQSSFWSRTYAIRNRNVELNLYFGETKLSEFDALVKEAEAEVTKLGVTLSPESTLLKSNRAGLCFSAWVPYGGGASVLESIRENLEKQKWKSAND